MISIDQYRAAIGLFYVSTYRKITSKFQNGTTVGSFFDTNISYFLLVAFSLLIISCDIEINPGPKDNKVNLSLISVNFNSVVVPGKLEELHHTVLQNEASVIGITETWLSSEINSNSLLLSGYQDPERRDRDRHGGGVMVYVSNSISYKRHLDLESVGIESVWIEIPLAQAKVFIGTYYRSCSETCVASIENF